MRLFVAIALVFLMAPIAGAQTTQTATINLQWQLGPVAADGSNAPAGIKVERRIGSGGYIEIQQLGVVTSYTDTIAGDAGNTTYCYRVRAFNAAGDSPYSNEACLTTPVIIVPPTAPMGVTVSVTVTINVK